MDIDSIADLDSGSGSIISLYLSQGPALSARLTDLLKPVREEAEKGNRNQLLSVRADVERLGGLVGRLTSDPAAGFAVFASHDDNLFEVLPLTHAIGDTSVLGRRPYLRPLRVLPAPLHAIALVIERSEAKVFEFSDDSLTGPILFSADPGKRNYAGFKGIEEHRVQRHADEETAHMFRAVADHALKRHQEARFDFIGLLGHETGVAAITPYLHTYLERLNRQSFVVDPHTLTEAEIHACLRRGAAAEQRRHEEEIVEELLESQHRARPVAMGSVEVLDAVNLKAVEHLVLSGPVTKPGVECGQCGWLARSGAVCLACGSTTLEVEDVLGTAVEKVLDSGGQATQVRVASRLDAVEVGAFLRFATKD